MSSQHASDEGELPLFEGLIAGAGAFVLGYLVTYLWRAGAIRETIAPINAIAELFGTAPIAGWKIVGWLYYSAHFVAIKISLGPLGPRFVDLVQTGEGPLELLYLVPPVLLLGAGLLVARRSAPLTQVEALKAGGLVALGYAACAVVGVFLFQIGSSGPDLVPAVVVAGVIYPVVFGGVGGLLGARL